MDKIKKIKEVFKLYEYNLLQESNEYLIFAVGHNLYPGVEIVSLVPENSETITNIVEEYRRCNYSVRVCGREQIDSIEDYLFDWFFQVEHANKKISFLFKDYINTVFSAYALPEDHNYEYEFIECPYQIERIRGIDDHCIEQSSGVGIIQSIRSELDKPGIRLIIVEAAAGFGKTSTAMGLLNTYADVKHGKRPLYMELSKDRQAATFYYLLVSHINKTFDVRLGDEIVKYNILKGRIPLIIDGFDELLSEDLDAGSVQRSRKRGETMLSTIAELLKENSKIVLTTRKTAILSGQDFNNWYAHNLTSEHNVEVVRYKIDVPRIEQWLSSDKLRVLPEQIKDLSNPVLLGYLHYLSKEAFNQECKSDRLITNYINRLLDREIERQKLPFDCDEQLVIFERLASAFAYGDITAETRQNVKDYILMMSSDIIKKHETPAKDSTFLTNTLTNHALLDRKAEGNIGFINEFVLGLLLGYAMDDSEMKDYYISMSPTFLEKTILSIAPCDKKTRENIWICLNESCKKMTPSLHLMSDILLLHQSLKDYDDNYFEGYHVTNCSIGTANSKFKNCHFVNFEFSGGKIDFEFITGCTFINCRFKNVDIEGEYLDKNEFYNCTLDGKPLMDIEHQNELSNIFDKEAEDNEKVLWVNMLERYILVGGQGRRMQMISQLKKDFGENRKFKKIFGQLCAKGYILTNGDKSHISSTGVDYLNSHRNNKHG